MLPPSKRKLSRALALAIEDRKVPATPCERVVYGSGIHAAYGLYWPKEEKIAFFRMRDDLSFYLGYADPIAANSHMGRNLKPWVLSDA